MPPLYSDAAEPQGYSFYVVVTKGMVFAGEEVGIGTEFE
jgi:hypothetical protein